VLSLGVYWVFHPSTTDKPNRVFVKKSIVTTAATVRPSRERASWGNSEVSVSPEETVPVEDTAQENPGPSFNGNPSTVPSVRSEETADGEDVPQEDGSAPSDSEALSASTGEPVSGEEAERENGNGLPAALSAAALESFRQASQISVVPP